MHQALQEDSLKLLNSFMTQQQLVSLEKLLPSYKGDCQAVLTFLTGISSSGYKYHEQHYASLGLLQEVLFPCTKFEFGTTPKVILLSHVGECEKKWEQIYCCLAMYIYSMHAFCKRPTQVVAGRKRLSYSGSIAGSCDRCGVQTHIECHCSYN